MATRRKIAWADDMALIEKAGGTVPKYDDGTYVRRSVLYRIRLGKDGQIAKVLCSRCKVLKDPSSFGKRTHGGAKGYPSWCRACLADNANINKEKFRDHDALQRENADLRTEIETLKALAGRLAHLERELGMGDAE